MEEMNGVIFRPTTTPQALQPLSFHHFHLFSDFISFSFRKWTYFITETSVFPLDVHISDKTVLEATSQLTQINQNTLNFELFKIQQLLRFFIILFSL